MRQRHGLDERYRSGNGKLAALLHRSVHGDHVGPRLLDCDADVGPFAILLPQHLSQFLIELGSGEVDRLHLPDERHGNMAGEVDRIVARQVGSLEHLDGQFVERCDGVVRVQCLDLGRVWSSQGAIIGNASPTRVRTTGDQGQCGDGCGWRATTGKILQHDHSSRRTRSPLRGITIKVDRGNLQSGSNQRVARAFAFADSVVWRYQRSPASIASAVRTPVRYAPVSIPIRLGCSSIRGLIVWPWTTMKPWSVSSSRNGSRIQRRSVWRCRSSSTPGWIPAWTNR